MAFIQQENLAQFIWQYSKLKNRKKKKKKNLGGNL